MSARIYGDRFDARILEMVEAGALYCDLAQVLGVSRAFLVVRAEVLGLRAVLKERGRVAGLAKIEAMGPIRRRYVRPTNALRRLGVVGRTDDTASRIYRQLRAHRPGYAPACIDPDNVVACLFARGLTLPEIHEAVGVPPVEAVAAIRAHHGSLAA